jgi:DNA replication protein DnaD
MSNNNTENDKRKERRSSRIDSKHKDMLKDIDKLITSLKFAIINENDPILRGEYVDKLDILKEKKQLIYRLAKEAAVEKSKAQQKSEITEMLARIARYENEEMFSD